MESKLFLRSSRVLVSGSICRRWWLIWLAPFYHSLCVTGCWAGLCCVGGGCWGQTSSGAALAHPVAVLPTGSSSSDGGKRHVRTWKPTLSSLQDEFPLWGTIFTLQEVHGHEGIASWAPWRIPLRLIAGPARRTASRPSLPCEMAPAEEPSVSISTSSDACYCTVQSTRITAHENRTRNGVRGVPLESTDDS